jgi:hypothetical protein
LRKEKNTQRHSISCFPTGFEITNADFFCEEKKMTEGRRRGFYILA